MHGSRLDFERKPSLTRSQTDSNITYASDEIPEAPGSCCYITKEGDIDLQVVLKVGTVLLHSTVLLLSDVFCKDYLVIAFLIFYQAVHSVALRDGNCCTLRVCENILNLVELLIDMGVMKQCLRDEITGSIAGEYKMSRSVHTLHLHKPFYNLLYYFISLSNTLPESATAGEKTESGKKKDSPENEQEYRQDLSEESKFSSHNLLMNCVIRVLKHLGCPHGCSDRIRGPQTDFCRSQGQTILSKLHRASSKQFSRFLRTMVREQPISEILEFFHAFVGFCLDPSSLLSPLSE